MVKETMRAYVAKQLGGFGDLTLCELPPPPLAPGRVRVRVRAASLNYRDLLILNGAFGTGTVPDLIPLSDAAGEVVEIGEGVWRVRPGDRVAITFHPEWIAGDWEPTPGALGRGGGTQGVACEELVVHQTETVPIPAHLSFEEAACLPCAGVTAWSALTAGKRLLPGQTVLVQGSGGVSVFALQFARLFGARVIATTSSPAKAARLATLGADATIDYHAHPDWENEVLRLTGGEGADRTIDVGGGGGFAQAIAATRQGGQISLVGLLTGAPAGSEGLFFRGLSADVIRVGSRADFVAMNRAINVHGLNPVIDRVFSFNELPAALRHLEGQTHIGKIVLRME
jgi:NADPH:quinone reductase-like Zn-dependent oxidoreductase